MSLRYCTTQSVQLCPDSKKLNDSISVKVSARVTKITDPTAASNPAMMLPSDTSAPDTLHMEKTLTLYSCLKKNIQVHKGLVEGYRLRRNGLGQAKRRQTYPSKQNQLKSIILAV